MGLVVERFMFPNDYITNVDFDKDGNVDGFQFDLRSTVYRAMSLDCLQNLSITIDGKPADKDKVTLIMRGQRIPLTTASTLRDVWWGFAEIISIHVQRPGGLSPGEHDVECTVTTGFGGGLSGGRSSSGKAKMTVKRGT